MADGRSSSFRRQVILELLSSNGQVFVHDLAEYFNVALETIRRDLTKLASQNLVKKVHGGAVNIQSNFEKDFNARARVAPKEKKAIGLKAAELIKPGNSLFIGFGTTTIEFAQQIKHINKLTVITNSPLIAAILHENQSINAILLGGAFSSDKHACLGSITLKYIDDFFTDYAVIGTDAIDINKGAMDHNADEAALGRRMIKNSEQSIVLADSTKFYKQATNLVTHWEDIDFMVTNKKLQMTGKRKSTKTQIILTTV